MPLLGKRRRNVLIATAILLVLGTAGAFVASYFYSFDARFRRSMPAFEAYATRVMASDPSAPIMPPPPLLGAFRTGGVKRLPRGFFVYCDYGNPFDANGIAYSTEPLPHDFEQGRYVFKPITGNWYTIWDPGGR